ncbi:MAG: M42 family peptidase [Oscillospiraceae bacterium]|nr:M42 family peptidase [Oscillospiraceae bacterium]
MMRYLRELCALNGISGDEGAVRAYLQEQIAGFPGILEMRTDASGNLIVHKKGRAPAKQRVLIGAHMDEVGLIITGVQSDGLCTVDAVGGVDADAVIGRAVQVPGVGPGVIGAVPIHKLKGEERDKKPSLHDLRLDIGAGSREEAEQLVQIGGSVCFYSEWTELGGGRVASKAIDDRFGCAAMLCMLSGEIPYDTWFCFFVQEEIGLRGSKTAAFAVDPAAALILETTTAADLDGVQGDAAVCRLGGGPVVPFMDRRTIYHKELYKAAFAEAERLGIPCQTKTRIAGGNDAGSVSQTREGAGTLAISIPCRYLHTPFTVAQVSDMEQSLMLAQAMLVRLHDTEVTA